MAQAPAMPIFTDALIGDTTHLSAEEFGAYCRILFATWRNNGIAFADDNERLCRISGVAPQRWSRVRKTLENFFDLSAGTWEQKRLRKEWNRTQILIVSRREKGKAGSDARWLKQNEMGNASANALTNAQGNGSGNAQGYGNQIQNHIRDKNISSLTSLAARKRATLGLPNTADPIVRKQVWEQNVMEHLWTTLPTEEARKIIDAYPDEQWAVDAFNAASMEMKA